MKTKGYDTLVVLVVLLCGAIAAYGLFVGWYQ